MNNDLIKKAYDMANLYSGKISCLLLLLVSEIQRQNMEIDELKKQIEKYSTK